jgi:hypothetical protein
MTEPQGSEGQRTTDVACPICGVTGKVKVTFCANPGHIVDVVPRSLLAVAEAKAEEYRTLCAAGECPGFTERFTLTEALRVAEERAAELQTLCAAGECAGFPARFELNEKLADSERKREEMLTALRRWEAEQVSSVADEGLFTFLHSLAAEPKGEE